MRRRKEEGTLQFDRRLPIYQQGVDRIQELIAREEWASGSTVPSRRELAQSFEINPNTAQRIYHVLEEKGLIVTGRNIPSRVTTDKEKIKALRQQLTKEAVTDLIERLRRLGNSEEDIRMCLLNESQQLEERLEDGGGKVC